MMPIALLAERLRVEERLLIEAFAQRDRQATLHNPAQVRLPLQQPHGDLPPLALDRGVATAERAVLGTLLATGGTTVVNRPATTRLLADRLALLRHLIIAEIAVPETVVSFGEEATFAAIEELGYPVVLKSLITDPAVPLALIEDQDAAEALVEHRVTLGGEQAVLVQRCVAGPGRTVRLVIVGRELVGVEVRPHDGWRPAKGAGFEPYTGATEILEQLAHRVVERLGTGTYAIEVIEGPDGLVVIGADNLVDFRSLAERGVDVAGLIANFVLAQIPEGAHRG